MITEYDVIEYLTERHLDLQGGYPFDCKWHNGSIIIAAIDDDDSSRLIIYSREAFDKWVDDANKYLANAKRYGDACDKFDAILETMPEYKGSDE